MASRGDDVFNRDRAGDFRGTRPRRPPPGGDDGAAGPVPAEADAEAEATRSGMFGSTRLSGGSFKGRFPTGGSAGDRRYLSSAECATPPSPSEGGGSSSSSSSLSLGGPNSSSRSSGLNRIESGASSIRNYASRYIDAIRPRHGVFELD